MAAPSSDLRANGGIGPSPGASPPVPRESEPYPAGPPGPPIDVLVATYNSGQTLAESLASARRHLPIRHLIVVDHQSTDGTKAIARSFGAELIDEQAGLGRARNAALEAAGTEPVLFLDSDVVIVRPDFYPRACQEFRRPGTVAVVGMSVGHRFAYGLPLGLTMIGRAWSLRAGIPDAVLSRETYYLQRAARAERLRVRYVPEAMRHYGTYRAQSNWAEFQGAWVRLVSRGSPRELAYSYLVILLISANAGTARALAFSPLFALHLTRGFLDPQRWARLVRTAGARSPAAPSGSAPAAQPPRRVRTSSGSGRLGR